MAHNLGQFLGLWEEIGDLPVFDVCAAGKGMANDHCVISGRIELPPCLVCYRNILQGSPALESEGRNNEDLLLEEGGE